MKNESKLNISLSASTRPNDAKFRRVFDFKKPEKRKDVVASGSSYSERKITQVKELKTLLWGLDLDEGIRFVVDAPGFEHGAFLFVTKLDDKFCVTIKERVLDRTANDYVPGEKEQWKYFEKAEAAWQFISKYLKPPLEAYYY